MFYTTEDAIQQGLEANHITRERWLALRWTFKAQCKSALKRRQYNLSSMFATQAQFYREALDAPKLLKQIELLKNVS